MKCTQTFIALFFFLTLGYIHYLHHQNDCLFIFNNKCYQCDTPDSFWVGLPENCTICPNRHAQYVGDDIFPVWLCMPMIPRENEELILPPTPQIQKASHCPKNFPLGDLLGHCYSCHTKQPVRLLKSTNQICHGKRYLTEHRLSEKSRLCPPLKTITNPEVCLTCQGHWIHEKCLKWSDEQENFCQSNTQCDANHWCYPFRYIINGEKGLCRPQHLQKWVCSDTDGYNNETAHIFCHRQGMHIPTMDEIENEKDELLNLCPTNQVWTFFEDGGIYMDFTREYIFTREGMGNDFGGDNFYALCKKD